MINNRFYVFILLAVITCGCNTADPINPKFLNVKTDSLPLTLFFGGDLMLADASRYKLQNHGYSYPFEKTRHLFENVDVALVNMEAPACDSCLQPQEIKDYVYKQKGFVTDTLEKVGFDVLLLANNHMTDYGHEGMPETIANCEKSGIASLGAGINEQQARQGLIISKGNYTIGVLTYMAYRWQYARLYDHFARGDQPGVAGLSKSAVRKDIHQLKGNGADYIIVSVHWRKNYKPVTEKQKNEAKMIINAGADMVVGHGNHDYQPMEMIDGKPVFYSLGNFCFGTRGNSKFNYEFPLTISMGQKDKPVIKLIPVLVQNRKVDYQPRHLKDQEGAKAITEFIERSQMKGLGRTDKNNGWLILNSHP